jgi:hypothetical protein
MPVREPKSDDFLLERFGPRLEARKHTYRVCVRRAEPTNRVRLPE